MHHLQYGMMLSSWCAASLLILCAVRVVSSLPSSSVVYVSTSPASPEGFLEPLHRYIVIWLNGSIPPLVLRPVALHLPLQKRVQLLLVLVLPLVVDEEADI